MERYDGKTRKDDIRKYLLIGAVVIILLVGWFLLLHFFGAQDDPEPDYRVVYAGDAALDSETEAYLEEYIGDVVGDRNGDGKKTVEVLSVSVNPEDYTNSTGGFLYLAELMSEPDIYLMFLTDEPETWPEFDGLSTNFCQQEGYFLELPEDVADETFANRARVDDSYLFEYLGYENGPLLYAHICADEEETEIALALAIIDEIVLGSAWVISPQ